MGVEDGRFVDSFDDPDGILEQTKRWSVVGGLIQLDDGLLLVANRRRGGRVEWTPPGGVVDPGESETFALSREVSEEVGLTVDVWSPVVYDVSVNFPDRNMALRVQVFLAESWFGSLTFDDPDGIVEDGRFVDSKDGHQLLETAPRWVAEPVGAWVRGEVSEGDRFNYMAYGVEPDALVVKRL